MGKPAEGSAGSGCMCASHRAVRGPITEMSDHGEYTVTDLEAGLEHLKRGTAPNVDVMLVVAEPYYRSLEAAARTFSHAKELGVPHVHVVANKIKGDTDRAAVDEFCTRQGMPIIGTIAHETQFAEAERQAKAPLDFAPIVQESTPFAKLPEGCGGWRPCRPERRHTAIAGSDWFGAVRRQ
jgi:CO dehydrogenase maturation factor